LQYCPNPHAAELARTNVGIPRNRASHLDAATGVCRKVFSGAGNGGRGRSQQADELRRLAKENQRLKRLVTKLSRDLELSRRLGS
jgi:hypothetical protein